MENITRRGPITRRTMLRGAGVALSLPWLQAMSPFGNTVTNAGEMSPGERASSSRAVFVTWGLGVNGRTYTPADTGLNYTLSPTLKPLEALRNEFTVVSGLYLTNGGSHRGNPCVLTGTNGMKGVKARPSLDQELAEVCGRKNRFPTLELAGRSGRVNVTTPLSWSREGTPLAAENNPRILFDRMFKTESSAAIAAARKAESQDQSVLDLVQAQAKLLKGRLGREDQEKVEEYFGSIRSLEKEMAREDQWREKPRPQVAAMDLADALKRDHRSYQRLMYDMIVLALQTDSTRIITYANDEGQACKYIGNPFDLHTCTHHAEDAEKLKWYSKVDLCLMEDWAYFLNRLKSVKEGDGTLLDNTMVAWGGSSGAVNSHNRDNLPIMLCGGRRVGVKHQGHVIQQDRKLGDLWWTMADRMGLPIAKDFQGGEAKGPLTVLHA